MEQHQDEMLELREKEEAAATEEAAAADKARHAAEVAEANLDGMVAYYNCSSTVICLLTVKLGSNLCGGAVPD